MATSGQYNGGQTVSHFKETLEMTSTSTTLLQSESSAQQDSVQLNIAQYLELVTSRRSFSVASNRSGEFRVLVDNESGDRYCISSQDLFDAAWTH